MCLYCVFRMAYFVGTRYAIRTTTSLTTLGTHCLPTEPFMAICPVAYSSSIERMARNASCGTSISPICFMRFLPSFCFSSSFFFRLTSPP